MFMTEKDWQDIKYFHPNENWGDWRKMYKDLFYLLDRFRAYVGKPVIIHCGYATSGHSPHSYHYKGMAVDFHVKDLSVLDQFLAAERFDGFNGIGLYPMWAHPGLHVDIRSKEKRYEPDARWLGIYKNNHQIYVPLTRTNIMRYC